MYLERHQPVFRIWGFWEGRGTRRNTSYLTLPRDGYAAGGVSVHAPHRSQVWDLSFPNWGEKANTLRGHALAQLYNVPEDLGTANLLSVLSHSVYWKPKGPGREARAIGATCCLATSSWLRAYCPHSPGVKLYLSPVWLHRLLLYLSGSPGRHRGARKGGQVRALKELAPGSAACRPFPEGRCSGCVFPWGFLPPQTSCDYRSLSQSSKQRNLKFDPPSWRSSQVPDSSLSLGVVPPASLPQMSLAIPGPLLPTPHLLPHTQPTAIHHPLPEEPSRVLVGQSS